MSNSERIATIKNKHFWFLIMETEVPLLTLKYKYLFRPQFLSFWCYWISTCLKCGNMKSFSILYRMLNTHTHRPFWDHRKTECYKKTKGPHKLWLTQSGLPKRKSGQVKWWLCRCHSQERRTSQLESVSANWQGFKQTVRLRRDTFFFFFWWSTTRWMWDSHVDQEHISTMSRHHCVGKSTINLTYFVCMMSLIGCRFETVVTVKSRW